MAGFLLSVERWEGTGNGLYGDGEREGNGERKGMVMG